LRRARGGWTAPSWTLPPSAITCESASAKGYGAIGANRKYAVEESE